MNKIPYIAAALFASALLWGCGGHGSDPDPVPDPDPEPDPAPVTQVAFARGADISWVSEMEAGGITFSDSKGATDIFSVLKNIGMNSVRLRVWVNPLDPKGWSGKDDLVAMARRALKAGMAVMVDFHYSDFFADPSRQTIPSAWSSHSGDLAWVSDALASHTIEVLTSLKNAGVYPAWVQVGNETNSGMVWGTGKIDWSKSGSARYAAYVTLSNAGYNAVKQVFPNAKVIVHIADAYKAGQYEGWFFKEFKEAGGKFDVIGLSHYPDWSKWNDTSSDYTVANNTNAAKSVQELGSRFGVPVMIVETGYSPKDAAASARVMTDLFSKVKGLSRCAGVFYWEPEVDGTWKPALYDNSSVTGGSPWGAYGMGAFSRSGTVFSPIESILAPFGGG